MLPGKKTYIIAALVAGLAVLNYLGYIDDNSRDQIVTLLMGGGLATLRAGVSK